MKEKKDFNEWERFPEGLPPKLHGELMVLVQKIKFITGIIRFKRAN